MVPLHNSQTNTSLDRGDESIGRISRHASRQSRQSHNERRAAARSSFEYNVPNVYQNLNDASAEAPVQNPAEEPLGRRSTIEDAFAVWEEGRDRSQRRDSRAGSDIAPSDLGRRNSRILFRTSTVDREARMARRHSITQPVAYDIPDSFANLDELAVSPVENPDDNPIYEHHSLEQTRSREREYSREDQRQHRQSSVLGPPGSAPEDAEKAGTGSSEKQFRVSRLATEIYTLSYLVFFAIFGTLARLGLQALTNYPGTPVSFASLWPNFGGSLVMGFLAEDRMLFRDEWGTPTYENVILEARKYRGGGDNGNYSNDSSDRAPSIDLAAAKRAHLAAKKTIPLYIGLATGFCGSFTSFSSFIRDTFLALSNDMANINEPRNGGYSFMAVLAVVILTVSLSLAGLFVGAHIAIVFEPLIPSLPYPFTRNILDRLVVFLGWGSWVGAVLLSALPPDRGSTYPEKWRGSATFALIFAPLGCLCRFYISLYLNGRVPSFPLGTFAVNMFATVILGMSWDLAHVPLGGIVGCQVLQGIEDGFCGCLSTVSTWVAELSGLRRNNAYVYGTTSVLAGLAIMVAIMGGLKWSDGFSALQCVT